ncbi:PEP-CTERM sorting domain-containing protein [Nostoc sp. TCL26-01]|nr:PEP-CTERM sorting domain-containing protein [Nostoc sp. TCL26-01]
MDVAMNNVGDGMLISLDNTNFAVNCFELFFEADLFSVGQGINIDFLLSGVQEGDDLNVSFSITKTASIVAQVVIIDKDGKIIGVSAKKFPDLNINGVHTVRYDPKIFSAGWKVDDKGGAPVDVLEFFKNFLNQNISDQDIKDKRIKQVVIDLISTTNRDPIISIDTLQVEDTHPVPEPNSSLAFLLLLGAASTLKRKLKPFKSTVRELEKAS